MAAQGIVILKLDRLFVGIAVQRLRQILGDTRLSLLELGELGFEPRLGGGKVGHRFVPSGPPASLTAVVPAMQSARALPGWTLMARSAVARTLRPVHNWARSPMSKPDLAPPEERWTRIDEYLGALARRRTARRSRAPRERTEPEAPSLMLSTLPFAALIGVLGLLVVAFAIAAWPASQPRPGPPKAEQAEPGKASPGWFERARKEMR